MNGLTLIPGVLQCTPDDPRSAQVVAPLNASIENDGDIIYNGSHEPFRVPVLAKTRDIFPNGPIEGWQNAEQLTLIDFDRIAFANREQLLIPHLSSKTIDVYRGTICNGDRFPHFLKETAAIHVNQEGGQWFEFIINKTK